MEQSRASARPVFERTASRLQIDADMLTYLFNECLQDLLLEVETEGSCTIRGVGKLRRTSPARLLAGEKSPDSDVIVFDRTRHRVKNTPFSTYRLDKKINK